MWCADVLKRQQVVVQRLKEQVYMCICVWEWCLSSDALKMSSVLALDRMLQSRLHLIRNRIHCARDHEGQSMLA